MLWEADFEVSTVMKQMGPPITYSETSGSGTAKKLGDLDVVLDQWWTMSPDYGQPAGFSYGEGTMVFTDANGDKIEATYKGTADHNLDPKPLIELIATIDGGTGKYVNANGTFYWHGEFDQETKIGIVTTEGFLTY